MFCFLFVCFCYWQNIRMLATIPEPPGNYTITLLCSKTRTKEAKERTFLPAVLRRRWGGVLPSPKERSSSECRVSSQTFSQPLVICPTNLLIKYILWLVFFLSFVIIGWLVSSHIRDWRYHLFVSQQLIIVQMASGGGIIGNRGKAAYHMLHFFSRKVMKF